MQKAHFRVCLFLLNAKMNIDLQNTFDRALEQGINFFAGSAFSIHASNSNGLPMPVGNQLRDEIADRFKKSKTLELSILCSILETKNSAELDEFLRNRLKIKSFDSKYKNLLKIKIQNIFTTNVDNLFYKIYENSDTYYINDSSINGPSVISKSAIDLHYLHGSITNQESRLIFGNLDIANAFPNDPGRWNFLRSQMQKYPTIFIGYGLRDTGTLQVFAQSLNDHKKNDAWIVIDPDYTDRNLLEFYQALGLKIIESSTIEFLEYIGSKQYAKEQNVILKNHIPEEFCIPNPTGATRSISRFFEGSLPEWSDIYSPRVCKTSYYNIAIDILNGNKNLLITGGPAVGKSTLLMQIAASWQFDGHKLFAEDITPEQAKSISNKINNESAVFFIDNCQSSLEGIKELNKHKNIRYVLAERDYAYISSSYNSFAINANILDITELKEDDATKIYNSIPADLRKGRVKKTIEGDSIFEWIEKNCSTPTIKSRFANVIRELSAKDINLAELFILICYIHASRSYTSMDIIYSYLHGRIQSPDEIYNLIKTLGSSIKDYEILDNSDQDYYKVRSNILADLINEIAPQSLISRVMERFHLDVSSFSIPNYSTFKRFGYDARFFEKAFPKIEDGERIYDEIFKKRANPFILQQKALYLSKKASYKKAFQAIDEAISRVGSRNWSLKNSYAIILFKANIGKERTYDTISALNESMEKLTDCYRSDNRKLFHALTYADHAIQHSDIINDQISAEYLKTAQRWLTEESKKEEGNHRAKRLLRAIERKLQKYGVFI
ncbi:Uncharacterized protein ChrSV_3124 [Chromobacterium vaccinii]|nr:Uncharacterized protein ChrSW_3124 [Chromobacterium vaccinii]QND90581.1 Uncharacterized protein ChrSV_3124 [Chromobacterium vaccinii]